MSAPAAAPRTSPSLGHLLLLTLALAGLGGVLGLGWTTLMQQSLTGSGAEVVVTSVTALPLDRAGMVLLTASLGGIAAAMRAAMRQATGHAAGPLWTTVGGLLIGENLALALRLITLITITMRDAVEVAAATHAPPMVDLAAAPLTPWATAGVLGGVVLMSGLLVVLSLLHEPTAT